QMCIGDSSKVTVRVSEGPESVKVPEDIVGQSLEYARESIQHAGLTVGPVSTVNSATVPANAVISSDPAPGSSVAKDSAVKLQVSSGKVTVPDVVGRSRAEAEKMLQADDVRLNANVEILETEDAETGTVLEQSAPAGSSVSQGSTITLTVARRTTPTPTPTPSASETPEESAEPTQAPTRSTAPPSRPTSAPSATRATER
ncbi:serine/threonine-protein kinase, partial [Kocuria tytonicola]|uniref:PASTA domain-containing protein n=1 Tax=Kocuria tytonicola TaxID=2055946 RepID=UPI000EF95A4E